jgi:hypothetical protein
MLLEDFNIKTVLGNNDLELEADPGESFLVKDVIINDPADDYVSLWIDNTRVSYIRVGGELGNHLEANPGGAVEAVANSTPQRAGKPTILGYLGGKGVFEGYPVPTGSTFSITGAAQAASEQIVIYEKYSEGDITPDMQNGVESDVKIWINYGSSGAAINADGETELETPTNPADFEDFPFGASAPAGRLTEILGILASDFAPVANDGTDDIATQYLRLIKENTTLFDEDSNGLMLDATDFIAALGADHVGEGISVIGNLSSTDARNPLWFPSPVEFLGGERLTVMLNTEQHGTGQDISAAEQEVGFILRTTRT